MRLTTARGLPTVALLLAAWSLAAAEPELRLADGRRVNVSLQAADAWQWTFHTPGGPLAVAAADVYCWGAPREPAGPALVLLADGGLLVGELLSVDQKTVRLDSDLFGELQLPRPLVSGVIPRPNSDRRARDALCDRLLAVQAGQRLWLVNGDELGGALDVWRDATVAWRGDLGPLRTPAAQVAAMALGGNRKEPSSAPLETWVGLRDGSRVRAASLALAGERLQIGLHNGPTLVASAPDCLAWLQPLHGRVVYLSDLAPAEYRHIPYLTLKRPLGRDRNTAGSRLVCHGRAYLKGLGTYSASRITYLLTETYRRFEAELGVDDLAAGGGSVRFRLFADGQPRFASQIVRGGQAPQSVSLDITGAKRLDLVVALGERADQADYADWLDARVVKE